MKSGTPENAVPTPPRCSVCGKTMRVVSAQPDDKFINLQRVTYVCDCGHDTDILLAMRN